MNAPPRSRRRIGMLVAASWLGAAVLTGTIAWRAVAVLDTDTPRTGVLSTQEVSARLATAQAAATQKPTSGPSPTTGSPTPSQGPTTPSPSDTPTAPTSQTPTQKPPSSSPPAKPTTQDVTRTWPVTGGTISAACTGQAIRTVYATPADGWTVETGASGPDVIEVELHSGEQETKVTARCVGGVPTPTVTTGSGDEHGSEHDG